MDLNILATHQMELDAPKLEAILPSHIDSTMVSCFRSCPRKFYHEYILGLRPGRLSVDLHAGACFASATDAFYKAVHASGIPTASALDIGIKTMVREWGDFEAPPGSPKSLDRMLDAFQDYIATYPPLTDHVQPYIGPDGKPTFEYTFGIPLDAPDFPRHPVTGEPFIYCGRFDMLGTYMGRPCIKDDKTTKQAGPTWADQWALRSQFIGYCWATSQFGIPIDTTIIRGVVIQKTQIRQLEAIQIYPKYIIDRWYYQLRSDLVKLVNCYELDYWDYNLAESCTAYGGCAFTPICSAREPNAWLSGYSVARWNPLLKNPIAEDTL